MYLLIAILFTSSIFLSACGSSTTEELEYATAPTPAVKATKATTKESATQTQSIATLEPTEIEPTDTPKPTDIPPTPTPKPEPIAVTNQGFGQSDKQVGFAFTVENPNKELAFEDTQYQVALLDESGAIVGTESGYISLLPPNKTIGIANTDYLDDGVVVSSIEVQLNAGKGRNIDSLPQFTVTNTNFHSSDIFSYVSGVIQNPYDSAFEEVRVNAVIYDESNSIIGGGFTYANFIPANASTGVNMTVIASGKVANVELYPMVSKLSQFTSKKEIPEDATEIILLKQGFGKAE